MAGKETMIEETTPQPFAAPLGSLMSSDLMEIREALWAAMDDIHEHLQVAKYNLRGEFCGEIMTKPDSPQLIHEAGISASESVIERLRVLSCKISARLKEEGQNIHVAGWEKMPPETKVAVMGMVEAVQSALTAGWVPSENTQVTNSAPEKPTL